MKIATGLTSLFLRLAFSSAFVIASVGLAADTTAPAPTAPAPTPTASSTAPAPTATAPSTLNVLDFGARGDQTTDNTGAFQKALDAAGNNLIGGTVFVPQGTYLIKGHLTIPPNVTLEGIWQIPTAWTQYKGSTLLAVEGEGKADGPPFISLTLNSTLKGVTVFYPNQTGTNPPKAYPWTVESNRDNCSIVDVLLVNPYQAVDFASKASGRHYIRNLYGMPLLKGISVDSCLDVGRIENVHFWPFWNGGSEQGSKAIQDFIAGNGEAFIFARTDWEYVTNCFSWGYRIGYHFTSGKSGSTNGSFLSIGADATETAVKVDECQPPGLLITNGEFVSFLGKKPVCLDVGTSHSGVVQMTNCAFWGNPAQIASIQGSGTVTFNSCNFESWDGKQKGEAAIEAFGGNLIVNACNFARGGRHVLLQPGLATAVVSSNRFGGKPQIENRSNGDVQVGLNVGFRPPKEEAGAIVVDDSDSSPSFMMEGAWNPGQGGHDYLGGTHWAPKGTGECVARWTPEIPRTGMYNVWVYYGNDPANDHATAAPFTVKYSGGQKTIPVNLRQNMGKWISIGKYKFLKGRAGQVSISNRADANVVADAVKFVPAR